MSCSGRLVSQENIMIDKVATVWTVRTRKVETSAPMETGTAIKDYGETMREEDQRIVNLASQAVDKGTGEGKRGFGQVQWEWKRLAWWERWQRWRKEVFAKGQRQEKQQGTRKKVAREKPELVGHVEKQGTHPARCPNVDNHNLYAMDEEDSENAEEVHDMEEDTMADVIA